LRGASSFELIPVFASPKWGFQCRQNYLVLGRRLPNSFKTTAAFRGACNESRGSQSYGLLMQWFWRLAEAGAGTPGAGVPRVEGDLAGPIAVRADGAWNSLFSVLDTPQLQK